MQAEAAIEAVRLVVAFTGAAVLAAIVAVRLSLPFSVVLVLVGLAAGAVVGRPDVALTPQIVLAVLLPGLVFEAAIRTQLEDLRPALLGVVLLAIPGVVLGAAVVALVLSAAIGLDPSLAFVVGAMVSATDPAAVISLFKRLDSPRALSTLVEAESVLNDGTGIVLFSIAVAAVERNAPLADGLLAFGVVIVASIGIGALVGYAGSRLVAIVGDHLVELATTVVVAYGSYLVADAVHQSGIIATVVAGLMVGSYGRSHGMSPRTRETLDTLWEFIGFVLTAVIFLLVGLSISVGELVAAAAPIGWAIAAVLVARALIVYVVLGGVARVAHPLGLSRGLPGAWLHVLFWSGLRGAVAVALALSLPPDFPKRDLLVGITYGVVLFTLIVEGTTAGSLIRWLGLGRTGVEADIRSG